MERDGGSGLWAFLKAGGYDVCTDVYKQVTDEDPTTLEQWLQTVLRSTE